MPNKYQNLNGLNAAGIQGLLDGTAIIVKDIQEISKQGNSPSSLPENFRKMSIEEKMTGQRKLLLMLL